MSAAVTAVPEPSPLAHSAVLGGVVLAIARVRSRSRARKAAVVPA